MPVIYLYIPFPDLSHDRSMRSLVLSLRDAGLDFVSIADERGGQFLAHVRSDDLLLIAGHGLANHNGIFVKTDEGIREVTANDLAARIAGAGLKKTHEGILLLTCHAGGEATMKVETDNLSVSPASVTVKYGRANAAAHAPYRCMASLVAKALGLRSYRSIAVGGFPGALGLTAASGQYAVEVSDVDGSDVNILADMDHIQWFDASGRTTAETYDKVSEYARR